MSMKTQNKKKENSQKPNFNKSILIKIALIQRGKTQTMIADDLGITKAAVNRAITGQSKISRVDEWCEKNLGIVL